jgi:hypothetical protein
LKRNELMTNSCPFCTNVTFRYPAEFVPMPGTEDILATDGAQWFASILRSVPGLQIVDELCQEDWGVAISARRNGKQFWIGLSLGPDSDHSWLAHVHHGSFAWLQRLTPSGKSEIRRLVSDIHDSLSASSSVSAITWYEESEMAKAEPRGFAKPAGD